MSEAPPAQRIGEWLIRAACRRLPADRAERCREWTAEVPAILTDDSISPPFVRVLRTLAFCAGISRTTRRLSRSARTGSRRAGNPRWRARPLPARLNEMAVRVVVGLGAGLVAVAGLITVLAAGRLAAPWPLLLILPLGAGFDSYCLADIIRAPKVRYLRKWAWALICLTQMPFGGILYLTVGRIGPAQPVPPGTL